MKSTLGRRMNVLAVAAALAAVLPAAWGKGVDDFKLIQAIPADAFLAVSSRDHAGKEFINKQYARVWAAVEEAHFDRDIKKMLKSAWQQDQPAASEPTGFDQWWQQVEDLWTGVEWGSLCQREFAMGMKLGFPLPEFVVLMMPPAEKVQDSFAGLSGILKTLTELDPNAVKLTTEEDGETVVHRAAFVGTEPFQLGLTLARHGNVIVIGFGPTMVEQTLALLGGKGGEALAATARFKDAFKQLPPPADELSFVDLAKLFGQLREMMSGFMGMAEGAMPPEGEPGYEQAQQWKALPTKILDMLDLWEYAAGVVTTEGMLATTDGITVLRDDAKSRPMYDVLYGNKPLKDPLKYVPENAGEFLVTSGIDLPALYKLVIKTLREDVPDGGDVVADIESLKQPDEGGWDIENEIIGWIGGGFSMFTVPGKTPYSPSEFVLMLSVRDEDKARALLDRLLGIVAPMLANQQGSVVDAEIEGAEGFKSVVLPMLAMMGMSKPTVGVKDGWLFFGSSPEMIRTTLAVAAGKAPNFSSNPRFEKEGIPPEGNVTSLSFTDQTKLGEQLGQALQMVPMIGMMAPEVARNPVAQGIINMVGKAGRVVRKLDFFQSRASRATFDGKVQMFKQISTYREPPVLTKPMPPSTQPQSEDQPKAADD